MSDNAYQVPPAAAGGAPRRKSVIKRFQEKEISGVLRTLRMFNICNGLLLFIVYPFTFLSSAATFDITSTFFAAYCVMFALLLICFECNIATFQTKLRRNFGFLFSFAGRTAFLLFTATISMASGSMMGWLLGVLTVFNAVFNAAVLGTHPAFKKDGQLNWTSDPTIGYTTAGQQGKMFIAANPAMAASAINAGMGVAASNPQAASQVASSWGAAGGENTANENPFL